MTKTRAASFVLGLLLSFMWLVPSVAPERGIANAQTLANGVAVTGDFKGAGYQQIATLYDPNDDLGLRIVVLDPTPEGKFSSSQWFVAGANAFDLARMRVAAIDLNGDKKTDIAVLYNDGNLNVRVLVWLSTGTSFAYQGNAGWFRHTRLDWNRARDFLPGVFDGAPRVGLVIPYQLDDFELKLLYLTSTGNGLNYSGDGGAFDSGPGQVDASKARFLSGHFTRTDGVDQIAMIYQYPNFQIKVHVFDPSPAGLQPIGGWSGRWTSPTGFFDINRAKFVAADVDGDRLSDLVADYLYADGSSRIHFMLASGSFALTSNVGAVAFPASTASWGGTQIVAGAWNKDGKAGVATLTDDGAGATHVGRLTSDGRALTFTGDAWVTPANEVQKLGCSSCWPLNGMPIVSGGPGVTRRPLAVKIDNAPTARPHHGISQADMVIELLVEGYITRLAAYFHSQDPATVGAVRSVRFSDRYTTPMVRGSLIFSGASQLMEGLVRQDIDAGAYVGVSPQLGQGNAFYRTSVDGKVAPHNLFTSSQALRSATNDVGGGGAVNVPRWDFLTSQSHADTAGGFGGAVPASTLTIPYRLDARARYDYDAGSHTYARYQSASSTLNYVREVDGANGVAIAARNVVIITTDVWVTDVVDDAGGAPSLDMRLTGTGPATIFRDGLRQEGTWSRATYFDPFTFRSASGTKIYLSPGQTWIHVLPLDWTVPSS